MDEMEMWLQEILRKQGAIRELLRGTDCPEPKQYLTGYLDALRWVIEYPPPRIFSPATSPPAEMPPVDPSIAGYADAVGRPPIVLGPCVLFPLEKGKKKANSCVGCTTGCRGKNKQEPELKMLDTQFDVTTGAGHPIPERKQLKSFIAERWTKNDEEQAHGEDEEEDEGDEEDNASASE